MTQNGTVSTETWPELLLTHNLSSADYYFNSRAHHSSHQDLLHDHVSTAAFRKAISLNQHLIKNKTVLIIGGGLSVLPFLAAEAGAAHVHVHCTHTEVAKLSELVTKANGLDSVVHLVPGTIADLPIVPHSVDIIMSDLVGTFLFYESQICDFLLARDRFLKPKGLLFPERLTLSAAGVYDGHDRRQREEQWKNFWGVNLSPLERASRREPFVEFVDERNIVTEVAEVASLNLYDVAADLLSHANPVCAEFGLLSSGEVVEIGGVAMWFDVLFDVKMHAKDVEYSTSPYAKPTVWKQTTLTLEKPLRAALGEAVEFRFAVREAKAGERSLEVKLGYTGVNEFFRLA
jgi:protein arginine N-methyltransferase 1